MTLAQLYSPLRLSHRAMNYVHEAHKTVLCHGHDAGTERVVVVDCKTGNVLTDEISKEKDCVQWEFDSSYEGNLVVVHNHPDSRPFSPGDLYTFASTRQIQSLSAHGHDGTVYVIHRSTKDTSRISRQTLDELYDHVNTAFRHMTTSKRGELFVQIVADKMGWSFLKGGDSNE